MTGRDLDPTLKRLLGSNERVPTQIYNGYGAFVSSLYEGRKGEKLYM